MKYAVRLRSVLSKMISAVTCLILLGVLAGCSSRGSTGSVTLHIWYSTDDPVEHTWAQKLPSLFERTHHNIKVDLTSLEFEDFNPKMQLALSSGHPPDLAYATPRSCGIPVYVQHDKLVNLTAYAKRYGWSSRLRAGLLQDYNSPFGLYATQKPGLAGNKVPVYGVPTAMAAVAIMYNSRILHRLHQTVPTTLAQFSQDLVLAKRAGVTPIAMGNADGWVGDDWYQTLDNSIYGYGDLERELRLDPKFTFKRPGFLRMSNMIHEWGSHGDFTSNFGGLDAQDGVTTFFKGKSLFELVSSSENSQILALQRASPLKIGIFPFPAENSPGGVMPQSGYEGWIVPKAGKNHPAAVKFINWLLTPSTMRFMMKQGMLPSEKVPPGQGVNAWQQSYLSDLNRSRPGAYLDAAPVPNLNATMEANVQLLLQSYEHPSFLPHAMQLVYSSHGANHGKIEQIDCEF